MARIIIAGAFFVSGILLTYISLLSPELINRKLAPYIFLFFMTIGTIYPYIIEIIISKIKRKKIIKFMKSNDTSYIFKNELQVNNMKENTIAKIVKIVNPEYMYTDEEDLQKYKEFAGKKYPPYRWIEPVYKSLYSYERNNKLYVKDFILGRTYKNNILKLYNIKTERFNYVEYRRYHNNIIFEGLFLSVEKSNNIYSNIRIGRKGIHTGIWNVFIQKSDKNLNNEIKDLLKYYTIFAENVDEVNKYISDRLVEYLLQVKKEFPFEFEIVFNKQNTYLKIFTGKIFKHNSIKKEKIEYYYSIIKYATDMISNISILI